MKKVRTTLSFALLGIVVLVSSNEKFSRYIDDTLLLERRNPGYHDYLSKSSVYYVSKNALDKPNANLLTNVMQNTDFVDKGFKIQVHDDGSFTFSGTYSGEKSTYIYPMEIGNLPSGNYIVSDGGASINGGIEVRVFGVRELPDGNREFGNCVCLPGDGLLYWDADEYDKIMFDVRIYPEFSSNDLRFYPMLCSADYGVISYQDALRKLSDLSEDQNREDYVSYMNLEIDRKSLDKITVDDWKILCNEARRQKHVEWISVDFGDGGGIQICGNDPDKMLRGDIDSVGRVREELTE